MNNLLRLKIAALIPFVYDVLSSALTTLELNVVSEIVKVICVITFIALMLSMDRTVVPKSAKVLSCLTLLSLTPLLNHGLKGGTDIDVTLITLTWAVAFFGSIAELGVFYNSRFANSVRNLIIIRFFVEMTLYAALDILLGTVAFNYSLIVSSLFLCAAVWTVRRWTQVDMTERDRNQPGSDNRMLQLFSYRGRIKRVEYLLSWVATILLFFVSMYLMTKNIGSTVVLISPLMCVLGWFATAQTAKRCHDCGKSGWLQLIPFYSLVILFMPTKE